MNIDRKLVFALGSALLLASCAEHSIFDTPGDMTFGEANRQTMMAQVVNPDPYYPDDMTTSGEHAADAIERYRTDSVKEPQAQSSTSGSSGRSN